MEIASGNKKLYFIFNLERKRTNAVMMTRVTMPKVCATTAITSMVEQRNHGTAHMKNFMQLVCAKTVILTITIVKGGKVSRRMLDMMLMSLNKRIETILKKKVIVDFRFLLSHFY